MASGCWLVLAASELTQSLQRDPACFFNCALVNALRGRSALQLEQAGMFTRVSRRAVLVRVKGEENAAYVGQKATGLGPPITLPALSFEP